MKIDGALVRFAFSIEIQKPNLHIRRLDVMQ